MIRVLHIIEQLDRHGGTPRKLLWIVRHSDSAAVAHDFITFYTGSLDDSFRELGSSVHNAGSCNPAAIALAIHRAMRRQRPDVAATHFTRALLCATPLALLHKIKLLHHEHGSASLAVPPEPSFRARRIRELRRLALLRSSLVLCNSKFTKDSVAENYGVPASKIRHLYNPVPDVFAERLPKKPPQTAEITLLHIGGLIPSRDQRTLLDALAILRQQRLGVRLVIIGDGEERANLITHSRRLGISDHVNFRGYVDDVSEDLLAAAIYINPAIAEGFGIAVAEAMLSATPVVVADAGAHPELIEHSRTGILYRPHDSADLASAIRSLIDAPETARSIASNARNAALERFAPATFVESYLSILRSLTS